jgi:hypothetical protein
MRDGELFSQQSFHDASQELKRSLVEEIQINDMASILNTPLDELARHFGDRYRMDVPRLKPEELHLLDMPREVTAVERCPDGFGRYTNVPKSYVEFTVCVPFEGDPSLLHLRPTNYYFVLSRKMSATVKNQEVQLYYQVEAGPTLDVKTIYGEAVKLIQTNLQNLARDTDHFNADLPRIVREELGKRKRQAEASQTLIRSINIPVKKRPDIPATYSIPEVRRKPQIKEKTTTRTTTPDPTLAPEEYENILLIIKDMSLALERSPKTFVSLSEEDIRNFFLILLNGHYQGTATGETFNGNGKTDILIRHQNANAFIAECKFWRGQKALTETIEQLLGYVTWRDTKTAIILFNKTSDLSSVLAKADETMKQHKNFKAPSRLSSPQLSRTETVFAYKFVHPSDSEKEIYLTLLGFQISSVQNLPA